MGGIDFAELDRVLREAVDDFTLATEERVELRELGARLDADRLRYLRNRAFALGREMITAEPARTLDVLRWLEQVVKTLDVRSVAAAASHTVFFTPGEACLRELRSLLGAARTSADLCVFTIADDRLTDAILDAHRRGVAVRIVTDDDKCHDSGSDIARLAEAGVPVRVDDGPHHMHHKFAVFDGRTLANGSFNWTRSASASNNENLVVSVDAYLVRCFAGQFEQLWSRFPAFTVAC